MAEYLIQDTTLDAIADAINAKTGGSSAMTPAEMVTEIGSIQTGGGGLALLASGTYTLAQQEYMMTIPFSAAGGIPLVAYCEAVTPIDNVQQTDRFLGTRISQEAPISETVPQIVNFNFMTMARTYRGTGRTGYGTQLGFSLSADSVTFGRTNNSYPIVPNTYNWYIWGLQA